MKHLAFALVLAFAACTPALDDDAQRADSPRVMAVRADPPEAKPGAAVQLSALYTDGTIVDWSLCVARKALAESGPIANECLAYPDERIPLGRGATAAMTIPTDACRLFGPDPPITGAGGRPVDPDATGGYYQPGLAADAVFSVRVHCNLSGATQDQVADFESRYIPNKNPEIADISVNGTPVTNDEFIAKKGTTVRLRVSWSPDSAEHYLAFDPSTHRIVDHRESLRVSWLATTGHFATSRTGVDESDPATATENAFAVTTDATLYAVLRDPRGGTTFRTLHVKAQ
jgi:hypothetical protein